MEVTDRRRDHPRSVPRPPAARPAKGLRFTIIASALLLVGLPMFWALDNSPPYSYDAGEVVPDPAPDGAQVSVHWRLEIHRICPGIIQRQIVDARDEIHNYDPVLAASPEDVSPEFWATFKLPLGLPAGPARYRVHASYSCNPLQRWWPLHVTTPEIRFTLGDPGRP
jgi:hypothetical protein